jgi:isopentenyl phosphate kinase
MLTFLKIGGSLITDKRTERSFRTETAAALAGAIHAARVERPELGLLIGHGSGSFGHFAAVRHGTMDGVHTAEDWRGYAEVAATAADLNALVAASLREAGIPALRVQPSASALCDDGVLRQMAVEPIRQALQHGLVPLVYGDVALDSTRGGTIISTESILTYLANHLPVAQILLLGEVAGVLDAGGEVIPQITPATIAAYEGALGGSAGTDVTGGMLTKVRDMLALVIAHPALRVRILDGRDPEVLRRTLTGDATPGTLITG